MDDYIAPLLLFIVLFVGFGLTHRHKQSSGDCKGCSGCSDKSACSNEDKQKKGN